MSYITVVRYKLIQTPLFRFQLKNHKTFRFIVLAWCTSVFIVIPNFFTLHLRENLPACVRRYPGGSILFRLYGVGTTMIFVGTPFLILGVTYILTIKQLYFTQNRYFQNCTNKRPHNIKKILRLFGVFIIATALSWFPFIYAWVKNARGDFGTSNAEEVRKARMYRFTIIPSLASGMVIVTSGSLKCWKNNKSRSNTSLRRQNKSNKNQHKDLFPQRVRPSKHSVQAFYLKGSLKTHINLQTHKVIS